MGQTPQDPRGRDAAAAPRLDRGSQPTGPAAPGTRGSSQNPRDPPRIAPKGWVFRGGYSPQLPPHCLDPVTSGQPGGVGAGGEVPVSTRDPAAGRRSRGGGVGRVTSRTLSSRSCPIPGVKHALGGGGEEGGQWVNQLHCCKDLSPGEDKPTPACPTPRPPPEEIQPQIDNIWGRGKPISQLGGWGGAGVPPLPNSSHADLWGGFRVLLFGGAGGCPRARSEHRGGAGRLSPPLEPQRRRLFLPRTPSFTPKRRFFQRGPSGCCCRGAGGGYLCVCVCVCVSPRRPPGPPHPTPR